MAPPRRRWLRSDQHNLGHTALPVGYDHGMKLPQFSLRSLLAVVALAGFCRDLGCQSPSPHIVLGGITDAAVAQEITELAEVERKVRLYEPNLNSHLKWHSALFGKVGASPGRSCCQLRTTRHQRASHEPSTIPVPSAGRR